MISFNMHSYAQDANPAAIVGETVAANHGIGITVGERAVARTLTSHAGRYDLGTENFVVATLNSGDNSGGFRTEPGEHLVVAGAQSASHGGADDNDAQANHIVVFQQNQRNEVRDLNGLAGDGPSQPGMKQQNYVMAFAERTRAEGRTLEVQDDLAYALANPGSGGRTHSRQIAPQFGVRRLTPVECERLQGFPDNYTAWGLSEDGTRLDISDSVRYRMLGNAVCRNVSAWIDRRIIETA